MDYNSLREEIDQRKKQQNEKNNILGEKISVKQTGDQFLRELMHSTNTGQETNASVKVKQVDRVAESKITGKEIDPNLLNHISKPQNTQTEVRTASQDAKMAEVKRIQEMNRNNSNSNYTLNNNSGIADAIAQYTNTPQVGAPMSTNLLTEEQMLAKYRTNSGITNSPPNTFINEQVTNVARELLNENFGKLYAEAMKNSIIETYKAQVIKEAINENRGYIEQIVRDTIIDLQRKAQSKK